MPTKEDISEVLGSSAEAMFWATMWDLSWVKDKSFDWSKKNLIDMQIVSGPSLYKVFPKFIRNKWIIEGSICNRGHQRYRMNWDNPVVVAVMKVLDEYFSTDNIDERNRGRTANPGDDMLAETLRSNQGRP